MESAEEQLVLGTAGHIDHGKTALIRALTGVDTDRLPEEKARGITIDLGFAPLELPGGRRASVVDVPGHEKLVRTMVAGATGIDLVLLVVASDEGVMPQTREHVAICELLGIERGVVAITKIDVAGEDLASLASAEVREYLSTTRLAGAPLVPVSALTGEGIDALRAALTDAVRSCPPRTPRSGPPRLSVDRAFAARGFGAVATGTLVGGELCVGDSVELWPSGRRARVRGLQCHGAATERARPGLRCAVNLQGLEVGELSRGDVVTAPGAVAPTHTADVELCWLEAAPASPRPVAVELLAGTAQRRARVAAIGAPLAPGRRGFARLHVDGPPLALLPGDRFVLRGFARTAMGGRTLGGGVVLDPAPPRRRRSDPALARELETLASHELPGELRIRIGRAGLTGADAASLQRESGRDRASLEAALRALRERDELLATASGRWLAASALRDLERRLLAALEAYHAAEPIRPGMLGAELRGRLPDNVPRDAAELALARLAQRGEIEIDGELVRRAGHTVRLDPDEQTLVERLAERTRAAGLDPPAPRELGEELGVEPQRLRELLAHLERQGRLVHAGNLWFDRAAVDALRERVVAHLREHGRLETLAYKALIGTTRRAAIPLMELFDDERLTIRRGDARLLRRAT